MSIAHFNAFMHDVRQLKAGSRFYHPKVNANPASYWRTSLTGLIQYLQGNINGGPITMDAAMQRLQNRNDSRLTKYMPAIERLVRVWGTHHLYPQIPAGRNERREKALFNFANSLMNLPPGLQPTWQSLEQYGNVHAFGAALGPGYIQRVQLGGGNYVDITARSLLLNPGLTPPPVGMGAGFYIASLRLTEKDLQRMSQRSVLDVGCGGAFFRSEMAVLYGCATDGIDLNAAHINGAAVNEAKRRYVRSMLYLKMLKDLGTLRAQTLVPAGADHIVDRIAANLPAILQHYQNNVPSHGDLLNNFVNTAHAIRGTGWDYSVTMFVLCYFNPAQQTTSVDAMCNVTNRMVCLHSGRVGIPQPLTYASATITANHAGAQIQVLDTETHRIRV